MPGRVRMNEMMNVVGDDVNSSANQIRIAGEDMFSHLRGLVSSGQLTGEGIQQALESSQTRWNAACDDFATAETRFGGQAHNTYANTMAADHKGGGFF